MKTNNKTTTELLERFVSEEKFWTTPENLMKFVRVRQTAVFSSFITVTLLITAITSVVLLNVMNHQYDRSIRTDTLPLILCAAFVVSIMVTFWKWARLSICDNSDVQKAERRLREQRKLFKKYFQCDPLESRDTGSLRLLVREILVKQARFTDGLPQNSYERNCAHYKLAQMFDIGKVFVQVPTYKELFA